MDFEKAIAAASKHWHKLQFKLNFSLLGLMTKIFKYVIISLEAAQPFSVLKYQNTKNFNESATFLRIFMRRKQETRHA